MLNCLARCPRRDLGTASQRGTWEILQGVSGRESAGTPSVQRRVVAAQLQYDPTRHRGVHRGVAPSVADQEVYCGYRWYLPPNEQQPFWPASVPWRSNTPHQSPNASRRGTHREWFPITGSAHGCPCVRFPPPSVPFPSCQAAHRPENRGRVRERELALGGAAPGAGCTQGYGPRRRRAPHALRAMEVASAAITM